MKKQMILVFGLAVLVCAAAAAQLPRGENAIFLNDGRVVIDHIVSYSGTVVRTRNGEINVGDLWMINYEENSWDYPGERQQMGRDAHYLFLRNGNVVSGEIVSFRKKDDVGRGVAWGYAMRRNGRITVYPDPDVLRVYFSRDVPGAYQNQNQNRNQNQNQNQNRNQNRNQNSNPIVGTFTSIGNTPASELRLNANGAARLTMLNNGQVMTGTWEFNRGDTSIIVLHLNGMADMTFGRDANDLVGLNYDKKVFGQLRFRR
jgi:hypothetical protein